MIVPVWPADPEHLARAIERLREGAVIVFPTETVYGVGCRAQDVAAVRRLYEIKRRPGAQPAVLLVLDADVVRRWAVVSPRAEEIMGRFWPGALTLVLPRRPEAPAFGASGPTLAFRAPDHPVALALLRGLGEPIASSSANRAGGPAPTEAAEAIASGLEVDLVLDGGRAALGQASTILDLSGDELRIQRRGAITEDLLLGRHNVQHGRSPRSHEQDRDRRSGSGRRDPR